MVDPYFEDVNVSKYVRTFVVLGYPILASLWMFFGVSKISPGCLRLITVLPIVAINAFAPLTCTQEFFVQPRPNLSYVGVVGLTILLTWFLNLKVLAYALNRGVLTSVHHWGFWRFTGVMLLPINPKVTIKGEADLGKNPDIDFDIYSRFKEIARLAVQMIIKYGVFLLCAWVLGFNDVVRVVMPYVYAVGLLVILGFLLDGSQFLAALFFGIPTHDSFNHPYLARDLKELWSQRWNITTAIAFKAVSYDIVIEGQFVKPLLEENMERKKASELVKGIAILAIFALSGVVHAVFFWYITGSWSWVWGLFYFSFGPLLLLEIKIKALFVKSPKKSTDGGLTFIKACCSILGVGYVTVVSCTVIAFLFVPPVEDAGIKTAAVAIIEAHFGKQE